MHKREIGLEEKEEMRRKKWRRKDIGKGNFIFREFAASVSGNCKVFEPKRDFSSYSNIFFRSVFFGIEFEFEIHR